MNKTIGSVSALIALSAATASAEIRAAPFSGIGLPITSGFSAFLDMDGDSNDDFYVNSPGSLVGISGEVVVDDTNSMQTTRFALGAAIGSSETTYYSSRWTNWIGLGRSYAGVKLVGDGTTNWGWIEFYLPDSSTGVIVRGAWETVPGRSIKAGVWPATTRILDFDGDGITDVGVYRSSSNTWHAFRSTQGEFTPFLFGIAGDIHVPADFDGDGLCDFVVFRPSTATWYIFGSATGGWAPLQFGAVSDQPIPADFDGDGKADLAVLRPTSMTWYIWGSSAGSMTPFVYGAAGDWPIPADYDGDGLADAAVLRQSTMTWYMYGTSAGPIKPFVFGAPGDRPVPGDYDGDGIIDCGVFRPSNVTWYIYGSRDGPITPFQYGTYGDVPLNFPPR